MVKGGGGAMRLLNIFLPPVPVLLYGKPIQGLINIGLCILLWIPAVIHSWGVTTDAKADRRMKKQTKQQAKMYKENLREQEQQMKRWENDPL